MSKQLKLFPELYDGKTYHDYVPFVSEVETFNATFGKPNNYEPTIPEEKEWKFVYDFILEVRNKVRPAILKNLRKDGILYIERETEK